MVQKFATLAGAGAVAVACLATGVGHAQAGWIIGLVDGKTLVTIDPASRKVTSKMDIAGAERLLGIDVRPADGMLYGVAADGSIVTLDVKTGKATVKSKLSEAWKSSTATSVDFNPAADRLRIMSAEGASLRVNADDGKTVVDGSHKYKMGDSAEGKTPKVVAGAYTNSRAGTKATALYNIDATAGTLVMQAPPNDGVLNTVGSLGVKIDGATAFNIVSMADDKNDAWLVANGVLHKVDLQSGKASAVGKIEGLPGTLMDIAWVD